MWTPRRIRSPLRTTAAVAFLSGLAGAALALAILVGTGVARDLPARTASTSLVLDARDRSVSTGVSGGPLINAQGRVVGLAVAVPVDDGKP